MKTYCLLLVVLCSVFIIQDVSASSKLRHKAHATATANVYVPKDYTISLTSYSGIQARDVGVGADGTIWVISNTKQNNDYATYRLKPCADNWEKVDGQGTYISVDPNGNAWIVTSDNKVYKYTGSTWQQIGATAYDISCSADGNVFHIGTQNGLYMLNRDGTSWRKLSGDGVNIAGGLSQSVWHLNGDKNVYRTVPDTFEQVTGAQGTDMAVGADGSVWLLTTDAAPNQFALYDENRQSWIQVPLASYLGKTNVSPTVRIAVAPNGDIIGVRQDNTLFRMSFSYN